MESAIISPTHVNIRILHFEHKYRIIWHLLYLVSLSQKFVRVTRILHLWQELYSCQWQCWDFISKTIYLYLPWKLYSCPGIFLLAKRILFLLQEFSSSNRNIVPFIEIMLLSHECISFQRNVLYFLFLSPLVKGYFLMWLENSLCDQKFIFMTENVLIWQIFSSSDNFMSCVAMYFLWQELSCFSFLELQHYFSFCAIFQW